MPRGENLNFLYMYCIMVSGQKAMIIRSAGHVGLGSRKNMKKQPDMAGLLNRKGGFYEKDMEIIYRGRDFIAVTEHTW